MKRLLNILISFSLAIFIISGSVILALKCKSLYYYDVKKLNISAMSGFSEEEIKNKNINFLNATSIITILLPIIATIPLVINFNYFFIKFHEAVFSNDYWIFDPRIDPVINMLPQDIFFHIGILILAIVLIVSILLQISYRVLNKRLK